MDKQTQQNLLDLVKRSYGEIAEDFDLTRQKHLWPELLKLAGQVKDGQSVLDVGCGNGRLAKAFEGKKINYVGVDSSEKMIEIAKSNFQTFITDTSKAISYLSSSGDPALDAGENPGIQKGEAQINLDSPPAFASAKGGGNDKKKAAANNNYTFKAVDILELDKIAEKNFDYVFCVAVLHHLPGQDMRIKALEQMKNKIKPDGRIIITVWNLWSQPKFRKLIFKFSILKLFGRNRRLGGASKIDFGDILFSWKNNRGVEISRRYYYAFTKAGLKKVVRKAKLKIEQLYQDKYNYYLILN